MDGVLMKTKFDKRGKKKPNNLSFSLDGRFTPKFFACADQRLAAVREIKERVARLKQDAGADSYQKELLCEKAIFVAILLETMETDAIEGKQTLDIARFTQGINCLTGLLRSLGLERKAKTVADLSEYKKSRKRA